MVFLLYGLLFEMASIKEVVSLYEKLKSEWTKKTPNLEICNQLLTKLKVRTHLLLSLKLISKLNILTPLFCRLDNDSAVLLNGLLT